MLIQKSLEFKKLEKVYYTIYYLNCCQLLYLMIYQIFYWNLMIADYKRLKKSAIFIFQRLNNSSYNISQLTNILL